MDAGRIADAVPFADHGVTGNIARVIAVTDSRGGIAKRGLSTALATLLRDTTGATTCVIDLDAATRDVEKRLGVDGPDAAAIARAAHLGAERPLRDVIAYDSDKRIWVIPAAPANTALDTERYHHLLETLTREVHYLVIDAPRDFAIANHPVDKLADLVDDLIVATTCDVADLSSAITYLRSVTRRYPTPPLRATTRVLVALIADEHELALHRLMLQRKLRNINDTVVALPRLWGRNASDLSDEKTRRPFVLLLDRLEIEPRRKSER